MRAAWVLFVLIGMGLCSSCDRPSGVTSQVHIGGVALGVVSKLIRDPSVLPSIKAAYIMEETRGDGELGPSDRRLFMRLDIKPESMSQWGELIEPHEDKSQAVFVTPHLKEPWWPAHSPLPRARLIGKPTLLRGSLHGWSALSEAGDRVYLYSYTM
jgi:hypothetical protein